MPHPMTHPFVNLDRAGELIRLALENKHAEAHVLLETVPEADLRLLVLGAVSHAATAYRETVGETFGISLLTALDGEDVD